MANLRALDDNAPLPAWRQRAAKAGHVIAVSGSTATGILKNDAEGVRIGSIIRMPTHGADVFGMVTSLKAENSAGRAFGRGKEIGGNSIPRRIAPRR